MEQLSTAWVRYLKQVTLHALLPPLVKEFALLVEEIPATTLFELAQRFQEGKSGGGTTIPGDFARLVMDAVAEAAAGWEGVVAEDGKEAAFERGRVRPLLESDVGMIAQLISFVADLFLEAKEEEERLEGEEKN